MDLQAKLTSLLKEKEEQEQIEVKAHQRIIELNRLIKSAERLIKDANEVFGEQSHEPTIKDLANSTDNHLRCMTQEKAKEASRIFQDMMDLESDIKTVKEGKYIRLRVDPLSMSCRQEYFEYAEKELKQLSEDINNQIAQRMEDKLKALQDKLDSL